jgi:hypothetical protein
MRMIPERCHPRSSSSNNNNNMMSRMLMRLLLLVVAAATVASASTAGGSALRDEESLEAATYATANLRRAKSGKPPPADSKTATDALLQNILEEVRGLQVRVKSLEDENESLRGGASNSARPSEPPTRRALAAVAGTTSLSLAQFNQYKKSVATQFATLNQSLQSTSAILDAFKVDVNGKLGKVQADLQKALNSMLVLANKTEETDQKTVELDSALNTVSGRVGTLETTTENFTTGHVRAEPVGAARSLANRLAQWRIHFPSAALVPSFRRRGHRGQDNTTQRVSVSACTCVCSVNFDCPRDRRGVQKMLKAANARCSPKRDHLAPILFR